MSKFTGDLTITQKEDAWRVWRLEQQLVYEVGELGSGRIINVPKGFETDGASIPRPLWWLLPTWGSYSRAAVIHDYLYVRLKKGTPHVEGTTRKAADKVFLEAMEVCGVTLPIRYGMWAAVRAFGGIPLLRRMTIAK